MSFELMNLILTELGIPFRESPGFIVHHRQHITARNINDPKVTLSWDNLEYVCKSCHDRLHDYCDRAHGGGRKITFDEMGNPIPGGQSLHHTPEWQTSVLLGRSLGRRSERLGH